MRILIVRLSALGDVALTLPLYFNLREFFPTAEIGWVIEERCAGVLATVAGIDHIHIWRKRDKNLFGIWRLASEIKKYRYEIALDAQGLTKSALIPLLAGIKKRIGFRRAPLESREIAPLLNNCLIAPPPKITHIAARSKFLALPLGVPENFHAPTKFSFAENDLTAAENWRQKNGGGKKIFIFGIGTSWVTKILPPQYVAELANVINARGYQPAIIWGPDEKDKVADWQKLFGEQIALAPPPGTVSQMFAILQTAAAYAGPDSAPLHLAWLLNKPTFSWFGPSSAPRGAPPDNSDDSKIPHRHIIAFPPNRQRYGEMLWVLKPSMIIPHFVEWLNRLEDAN